MAEATSEFSQQLSGRLFGVIHCQELDALWLKVEAEPEGWYASLTGDALPDAPLTTDALKRFITEVHRG